MNATNIGCYNDLRIKYPGFVLEPPVVDINKLASVIQSVYPTQVLQYSLGDRIKENPTTSKTTVSEDVDNVGLFPPNGKNQEKLFPQNSSPKNASKSNDCLGKLNIDQSVEEINEEINERGSYQPPDGQGISHRGRSRSPKNVTQRDRYRYDVTDRRYRYDNYANRSDSSNNSQLTASQQMKAELFLDKIAYFDGSNNKEALNYLAQCEEAAEKMKASETMVALSKLAGRADVVMKEESRQHEGIVTWEFASIVLKSSRDVGHTNLHTVDLQVTEGNSVFVKQYTIPLKYQNYTDMETKRLEEAGLISRSLSNWSTPCMVMPKKQDTNRPNEVQLRMVIDYRQLNKRILTSRAPDRNSKIGKVISNYPIPTIELLLARLEGCKYFSILDLRSGYHHIGLSEKSKPLTAFTTHSGGFQWNILPFGAGIGVQTFSFVINKAIGQCYNFAANYLDDIIVFSRTAEDHMEHLENVFAALQKADLKIKASKCEFFKNPVCCLEFLIGESGIRCDKSKVKAISKIKTPTSIEEVRHFNSMCSYYQKFISHYSNITKCFNDMMKKEAAFKWTKECDNAFKLLKEKLMEEPVLISPLVNKDYVIHCDASKYSYSGILKQTRPGTVESAPVAYFSGNFDKTQVKWNITEKEAYAIYKSVKRFAFCIT